MGRFAIDVTLSTPMAMMTSNEISMMMFDVPACCDTTPNHIHSLKMKMATSQRNKRRMRTGLRECSWRRPCSGVFLLALQPPTPPYNVLGLGGVGLALADPPRPGWLGSLKVLY